MAADTKQKRLSFVALDAAGTGVHTLPNPSGGFDLGDRQHFLDLYSGIEAGITMNLWIGSYPDVIIPTYAMVPDGQTPDSALA